METLENKKIVENNVVTFENTLSKKVYKTYIENVKENEKLIENIKSADTSEENKQMFGKQISANKLENNFLLAENFNVTLLYLYNLPTLEIVYSNINNLGLSDDQMFKVYEQYSLLKVEKTYIVENPETIKKVTVTKNRKATTTNRLILAILLSGKEGITWEQLIKINNNFIEPKSWSGFNSTFRTYDLIDKKGLQPFQIKFLKKFGTSLSINSKVVNLPEPKDFYMWCNTEKKEVAIKHHKNIIFTCDAPEFIINKYLNVFKENLNFTDGIINEIKEIL